MQHHSKSEQDARESIHAATSFSFLQSFASNAGCRKSIGTTICCRITSSSLPRTCETHEILSIFAADTVEYAWTEPTGRQDDFRTEYNSRPNVLFMVLVAPYPPRKFVFWKRLRIITDTRSPIASMEHSTVVVSWCLVAFQHGGAPRRTSCL